jgi:hypothetical protein
LPGETLEACMAREIREPTASSSSMPDGIADLGPYIALMSSESW